MISFIDILRNIRTAWLLALRKPNAIGYFNDSPTAFWQSFWAFSITIPPLFLMNIIGNEFLQPLLGPHLIMALLLAYVLDAIAFPVVMLTVADRMGLWKRYPRYIIANNWSYVVQTALIFPMALLLFNSKESGGAIFLLLIVGLILFYRAYVAKEALGVGYGLASGIVLLQILLSLVIQQGISAMVL